MRFKPEKVYRKGRVSDANDIEFCEWFCAKDALEKCGRNLDNDAILAHIGERGSEKQLSRQEEWREVLAVQDGMFHVEIAKRSGFLTGFAALSKLKDEVVLERFLIKPTYQRDRYSKCAEELLHRVTLWRPSERIITEVSLYDMYAYEQLGAYGFVETGTYRRRVEGLGYVPTAAMVLKPVDDKI